MQNLTLTKIHHAEQYVNDSSSFNLNNYPTASLWVKETMLAKILCDNENPRVWSHWVPLAKEIIKETKEIEEHGFKWWFAMATYIKAPRLEMMQIFWHIPDEKRDKYISFAKWKAGLINWEWNGYTQHITSDQKLFLYDWKEQSIKWWVQIHTWRGTAISGLSTDWEFDETAAFLMDIVNPQHWITDFKTEPIQVILSDNKYLPMLMALILYHGKQN